MSSFLRQRDEGLRELMDDPDCDPDALVRSYALFETVNAVVSAPKALYRRWVRPRLSSTGTLRLLDVGTGGADLPRRLLGWAGREGFRLDVVAIDPDPRAIAFARSRGELPGLDLRETTTRELVAADERFDVVVSNHVLHHLTPTELGALLADSERLVGPGGSVIHGDIERSRLGYAAFAAGTAMMTPFLLRGSFIRQDGLRSIRRSSTARELASAVPPGWWTRRAMPSRLELLWTPV